MPTDRDVAVVFTARETAELVSSPRDPKPLKPAEIEGRTLATLISTGTENGWRRAR